MRILTECVRGLEDCNWASGSYCTLTGHFPASKRSCCIPGDPLFGCLPPGQLDNRQQAISSKQWTVMSRRASENGTIEGLDEQREDDRDDWEFVPVPVSSPLPDGGVPDGPSVTTTESVPALDRRL
ncbi:unnamed protein product [Pleuronectes platessa]|uniref:Uncharacterized protein n=1 Tax=Pleuronectes platessa TaxID=8262 RepID=A0A9N7YQ72_PLEPL|nr:unnamed protein product [Pleuronectes platessa]